MFEIAIHSDKGPRANMEDTAQAVILNFAAPRKSEAAVLGVWDGVGGQEGGEVASDIARVRTIEPLCSFIVHATHDGAFAGRPDGIQAAIAAAFEAANADILDRIKAEPLLAGMASTAVCAVLVAGTIHVAWAGDSRCYLFSQGRLRRLTDDHSQVQQLIDAGQLRPEEAPLHPCAHVITEYLGHEGEIRPEIHSQHLSSGDLVVLCSDGLTDVLSDSQIAEQLRRRQKRAADEITRELVKAAIEAGTRDNTTVLCCQYLPRGANAPHRNEPTITASYTSSLARNVFRKE